MTAHKEETPKQRWEDTNENRRLDGCLFTCGDHGEWKERLKVLDYIPEFLTWMNSVKTTIESLPTVIAWMNKEEGGKTQTRLILGGLIGIFLTGFIYTAWTFRGDMQANLNAFKLESTERINLFKTEISERQAALKLEISDRQRVYEQNASDQNKADTARINSIVDAIGGMNTDVKVMFRLMEQEREQGKIDRKESKELIKDLQTIVLEHRTSSEPKKIIK